jgi:hypothetical protein
VSETEQVKPELPEICPQCGEETFFGYGLMGGGMGAYVVCDCGFFQKRHEKADEE